MSYDERQKNVERLRKAVQAADQEVTRTFMLWQKARKDLVKARKDLRDGRGAGAREARPAIRPPLQRGDRSGRLNDGVLVVMAQIGWGGNTPRWTCWCSRCGNSGIYRGVALRNTRPKCQGCGER